MAHLIIENTSHPIPSGKVVATLLYNISIMLLHEDAALQMIPSHILNSLQKT